MPNPDGSPTLAEALAAQGLAAPPQGPAPLTLGPAGLAVVPTPSSQAGLGGGAPPVSLPGAGLVASSRVPDFRGAPEDATERERVEQFGAEPGKGDEAKRQAIIARLHAMGIEDEPAKKRGAGAADPSSLAFVAPPPAPAAGGGFDPAALRALMGGGGGTAKVAAQEIPTMDPARAKAQADLQQGVIAAQGDVATAAQHAAEDAGVAAGQKAQELRDQGEQVRRMAQEHDARIADLQGKIDEASKDVASQRIDVEAGLKNLSTFDRARYTLASILGGFVNGYSGGRVANVGLEKLNSVIANGIEQQKQEIAAKRGRIGDMQGLVADMMRRFGNLDQAADAAHALALQQLDAEAAEHAAASGSEKVQAAQRLVGAQMQLEARKYMDSLYKYVPAHTAATGGGGPNLAQIRKRAQDIADKSGGTISVDDAFRRALAEATTLGTSGSTVTYSEPGKGAKNTPGAEKAGEQVRAYDNALDKISEIERMIQSGGQVSRERTAHGQALVASLVNELARAETGGTRAPSETEQELIKQQIPSDPNAWQFTGADLEKIRTTKENILRARARAAAAAGDTSTPGSLPGQSGGAVTYQPR